MRRIKLEEQPRYEFQYDVVLQPRDINYGGHLGHDGLVTLVHAARANLFRSLGFSEMDLGDGQTAIITSGLFVNYFGEGFMFDMLRIWSHVGEISRDGFCIFHRVMKGEKMLALVEEGFFAFTFRDHKIAQVPQAFVKALDQYLRTRSLISLSTRETVMGSEAEAEVL